MEKDKTQVEDILGQSQFFTGMEPPRKAESEGKYLLVTTQSNLYCAQQEADKLLGFFFKKRQTYENQTETPGRRKKNNCT